MLLDTSAWIEYFKGTEKGAIIQKLFSTEMAVYTCPLTLAEVVYWCHKNNEQLAPILEKIRSLSIILDLTEEIFTKSGEIYYRERQRNDKIGMIDCIIYTSAIMHGLKIITKDRDFEKLPNVEMI